MYTLISSIKKDVNCKYILIFMSFILILSSISAYNFEEEGVTIKTGNYSINYYNITYDDHAYNQSEATSNMWNTTWDNSYLNIYNLNQTLATDLQYLQSVLNTTGIYSTYNETYTIWSYNQSSTSPLLYNHTLIIFTNYNVTWDNSYLNIYNLNQTLAVDLQYLQDKLNVTGIYSTYNETYNIYAYNQSSSSPFSYNHTLIIFTNYNSTWDNSFMNIWNYNQSSIYSYNHTNDILTNYNNSWTSTYNYTYSIYSYNQSTTSPLLYNHTADVYTQWGQWFYNMTAPFTTWLSSFFYNYNQTQPAMDYADTNIIANISGLVYNYNHTADVFSNWNTTWDNSYLNIYNYNQSGSSPFSYNHTLIIFTNYNSTWDNSYLNIFNLNQTQPALDYCDANIIGNSSFSYNHTTIANTYTNTNIVGNSTFSYNHTSIAIATNDAHTHSLNNLTSGLMQTTLNMSTQNISWSDDSRIYSNTSCIIINGESSRMFIC